MKGIEWLNADPYLMRHLADHAAAGGMLDRLVTDSGYLAVADPSRLLPVLGKVTNVEARRFADLYRRTADRLQRADPIERMALLHLTAQQEAPELADLLKPLLTPRWKCRWASCQPTAPHRLLSGHNGQVQVVSFGEIDSKPVIVSGGIDSTIRIWDAVNGRPLGEPIVDPGGPITSVVLVEIDSQPVIVSGSWSGHVRMWDARDGRQLGDSIEGHPEGSVYLAVGPIDGRLVIVSAGSDGSIWLHDARTARPFGERLTVGSVALASVALGDIDGESVIASGARDGTVRIWNPTSRRQLKKFSAGKSDVGSVAITKLDGDSVLLVCTWKVDVVNARTGHVLAETKPQPGGLLLAASIGTIDAEPLILSATSEGSVLISDLRSGRIRFEVITGHEQQVRSVVGAVIERVPFIITAGNDGTVRITDLRTGPTSNENSAKGMAAAAVGLIDDDPVIVSGGDDGKVWVWESITGKLLTRLESSVVTDAAAVALGHVDGNPLIVSADGFGRTIRVWDARSGQPLGKSVVADRDNLTSLVWGEIDHESVVISGGHSGVVKIWSINRNGLAGVVRELRRHFVDEMSMRLERRLQWVTSVAFGEIDGQPMIASGELDGPVRIWNARTGHSLGKLSVDFFGVTAIALGEVDGNPLVAAGGYNGAVLIWNARSGHKIFESPPVYKGAVTSVDFCKVGGEPSIVTGGEDRTVRLWNIRAEQAQTVLEVGAAVRDVVVASDGSLAIAVSRGIIVVEVPALSVG